MHTCMHAKVISLSHTHRTELTRRPKPLGAFKRTELECPRVAFTVTQPEGETAGLFGRVWGGVGGGLGHDTTELSEGQILCSVVTLYTMHHACVSLSTLSQASVRFPAWLRALHRNYSRTFHQPVAESTPDEVNQFSNDRILQKDIIHNFNLAQQRSFILTGISSSFSAVL